MAKFKPENDTFRQAESMRLLRNLLSNFDDRIGDSDVFAVPAMLTTCADVRAWYKTALPAELRAELENPENRDHDSVCFRDDLPELLRCLWCQRKVRPHLRKYFATLVPKFRKGTDSFSKRFGEFCSLLHLGKLERDLLLARYLVFVDLLEWPTNRCGRMNRDARLEALAMYVDRSVPEVRAALAADAPLARSGVFSQPRLVAVTRFCGCSTMPGVPTPIMWNG